MTLIPPKKLISKRTFIMKNNITYDKSKMLPCPICKGKEITQKECGYSTFDPAWWECSCGFKVNIYLAEKSCDVNASSWNDGVETVQAIFRISAKDRKALGLTEKWKSLSAKQRKASNDKR